jgi:putative ABC transport system substrate-binding protein
MLGEAAVDDFSGNQPNDLLLRGRLPALAADVARRRPAAIIASHGPAALAAKAATGDIPIIFAAANDPVELGLVTSLNRPGGNVTGVSNLRAEITEKRLELLHKAVPAVETIALLTNQPDSPLAQAETKYAQSAAHTLVGCQVLIPKPLQHAARYLRGFDKT